MVQRWQKVANEYLKYSKTTLLFTETPIVDKSKGRGQTDLDHLSLRKRGWDRAEGPQTQTEKHWQKTQIDFDEEGSSLWKEYVLQLKVDWSQPREANH